MAQRQPSRDTHHTEGDQPRKPAPQAARMTPASRAWQSTRRRALPARRFQQATSRPACTAHVCHGLTDLPK
jgi:hypothetical protein